MAGTASPAAPTQPVSLGWKLLFGVIGVAVGIFIGFAIWAFDALSHHQQDYLVTGITLSLILGGIGFFMGSKNGWRDTFLYFLLLGFLDN